MRTVKSALLGWGQLQWPKGAPRSLADIASRVSEPLSSELRTLARSSYGPGRGTWDGARLDNALKSFTVITPADTEQYASGLPPLMPSARS